LKETELTEEEFKEVMEFLPTHSKDVPYLALAFNYKNNGLSTSNIRHQRTLKSIPLNIRHALRHNHTESNDYVERS